MPTAKNDPVKRANNNGTPIFKDFSTTKILLIVDWFFGLSTTSLFPPVDCTGIHEVLSSDNACKRY